MDTTIIGGTRLVVFAILQLCVLVRGNESWCFDATNLPSRNYSTHTAYEHVGSLLDVHQDADQECEPVAIYYVSKAGAYHPDVKSITSMRAVLPGIRNRINETGSATICDDDRDLLDYWEPQLELDAADTLSMFGENELEGIAKRYLRRYPSLAPDDWSVLFADAAGRRTAKTASAFTNAWYNDAPRPVKTDVSRDEWLLSFNEHCDKYKETEHDDEVKHFMDGPQMASVLKDVKQRLGLAELSQEILLTMYTACYSEYSVERDDPWCAVFSPDNLAVLEYLDDLALYWKAGYGHHINYKQACPLVADALGHFESVKRGTSSPHLASRFIEEIALAAFVARLGLLQDESHLSGKTIAVERKWKGRSVAPYAGNVALVLGKCAGNYKIRAHLNEHIIHLPHCASSSTWCDYATVSQSWRTIATQCNMQEICSEDVEETSTEEPPEANSGLRNRISSQSLMALCSFCSILIRIFFWG